MYKDCLKLAEITGAKEELSDAWAQGENASRSLVKFLPSGCDRLLSMNFLQGYRSCLMKLLNLTKLNFYLDSMK
jgi:hypothetical protein